MKRLIESINEKPWLGWLLFVTTVIIVFLLGLLAASIVERRQEAKLTLVPMKSLPPIESRSAVWGDLFPREYASWLQTSDTSFRSKYAGSGKVDYLRDYPDLVVLWAGYAFSRDYLQARGHAYAIEDIRETPRTGVAQPATCWTCKSSDVPRVMEMKGIAEYYKGTWKDSGHEFSNSIGCQDCHNSTTLNLEISRPALVEAFQRQGKDIKKASQQEMRSLVCAQCHVEYYFKGEGKYLTFPWDKGMGVEDMERYYDEISHVDWIHAISKTPMLKAQHPDYELFQSGIHAQRGVSCADCHMPYKSEGGVKFTDHHVASPLKNMSTSCQVCHRQSERELLRNVIDRQDQIMELRGILEGELVKAHIETGELIPSGKFVEDIKQIQTLIRHAQWRWDYVAAANGAGFHAPTEAARILGTGIHKVGEARRRLADLISKSGIVMKFPDLSTKEKAQNYIGLNMKNIHEEKDKFMKAVIPEWDKISAERERKP